MSKLRLSVAMGNYDRTRPIADGTVSIEGVEPVCILLSPEEMFFRAFRHREFDISELSLSSYCVELAAGSPHYDGLPVFLSRAFRHACIYIRTDRGIRNPSDLSGRRVGIAEYQLTANVWIRGLLEREFGVASSDIVWVRGGLHTAGRPEKLSLALPDGVHMEAAPEGATLDGLLADGRLDALIGPRAPHSWVQGHPTIARLFTDSAAAAADYYRRTGVFPIMHLLGLRRTLADEHPWLPQALCKAFTEAKDRALDALFDPSAPKVTLPFVEEQVMTAKQLMGEDYWPYGLAANRPTLAAFCDMHYEQGLSPRRLTPDELFHPATSEAFSI